MIDRAEYWERMRPLGHLRCRILLCLGTDHPGRPAFFDPPRAHPLAAALHRHLLHLHEVFSTDLDSRRLVAAALLTFGELQRAAEILASFPPAPILTDHGAGWCALIAYRTVAALLPVPAEVSAAEQWVQGSSAAIVLKQWFEKHRDELEWNEANEQFVYRP